MRSSSTGETTRLASLPVPSTGASACVCLCLACASVPILGATPVEVEGIQGPTSPQSSNAVVQIACLKPEEVSVPRHGHHAELAPFGLSASNGRFWPKGSWLLQ